jgi:Family 4 glycosyl hydrolase
MKLAVVGGGSTYTPELVAGLALERERLDLRELVLHDIDPERREVVGGLAGRMLGAAGYEGELLVADDLERALDGASFVLIQLRVGGTAPERGLSPEEPRPGSDPGRGRSGQPPTPRARRPVAAACSFGPFGGRLGSDPGHGRRDCPPTNGCWDRLLRGQSLHEGGPIRFLGAAVAVLARRYR